MRFVIHHHITQPDHYDLMIDRGESLQSWQIPSPLLPDLLAGREIASLRIQDHRRGYLDYQGPVSCDRGRVEILDTGEYTLGTESPPSLTITLSGRIFRGTLIISRPEGPQCLIRYKPAED